MLALYRSGRQADALDAYRRTRELLRDELGLQPSTALQQLEREILNHDPALDPSTNGAPHRDRRAGRGAQRRHVRARAPAAAAHGAGSPRPCAGSAPDRRRRRSSPRGRSGSKDGLPGVDADSIGVIDPHGDRITAQLPLGARPVGIAVGSGALWVSASNGTLTRVEPDRLAGFTTIPLGGNPGAVTVGGGAVWVADQDTGMVSRIDLHTNLPVDKIRVGNGPSAAAFCARLRLDRQPDRRHPRPGSTRAPTSRRRRSPSAAHRAASPARRLRVGRRRPGRHGHEDRPADQPADRVERRSAPGRRRSRPASARSGSASSLDGTVSRIDPATSSVTDDPGRAERRRAGDRRRLGLGGRRRLRDGRAHRSGRRPRRGHACTSAARRRASWPPATAWSWRRVASPATHRGGTLVAAAETTDATPVTLDPATWWSSARLDPARASPTTASSPTAASAAPPGSWSFPTWPARCRCLARRHGPDVRAAARPALLGRPARARERRPRLDRALLAA